MALRPPPPEALAALQRHQAGDLAGAHRGYRAVLDADPDDYHANLWLGALLHQSGRGDQAEPLLLRAIRRYPDMPDGWVNLAAVQQALDRPQDAESAIRRALELDPELAEAWLGLGNVLQERQRDDEALFAYRRAVALAPENPLPLFNLATLLTRNGQYEAAIAAARGSLDIDPRQAGAHGLVADCQLNLGRHREALQSADAGLALEPRQADLLYTRGFALSELGRLPEAMAAFDAALVARPDHGGALAAALFTRRQLCQWDGTQRLLERMRDGIARGLPGVTPFSFLAEAGTREEQRDCARLWSRQWPARPAETGHVIPGDARGRLTVGYLSADYYRHPTAYLAAGLFELHDRSRFRILAYSNSRDDDSDIRRRLEAAFDAFTDIRGLSPTEAAARIRADGVDILVDLKGHTLEAATAVMAQRPAPIQVQYLGYPGTMGADCIDYLIGDAVVTPATHQPEYDERIVALPHSYQVNDDRRPLPPAEGRRGDLGLPNDATVFCCFNNAWKFNRACFTAWMEILRATPGSVLWLLGRQSAPEVASNLRREAAAQDIDPERLVFSKSRPLEPYLALYHHADLFLDSWPYNAHTTASDALWMGCPVLTLMGTTFPSRVGASLLLASGLGELVCHEVTAYQERAISLATDPTALPALRRRLEDGRADNPLFDTRATTRAIEQAYETMARNAREKLSPPT